MGESESYTKGVTFSRESLSHGTPELVPGSKSTFTSRNFTFTVHVASWW